MAIEQGKNKGFFKADEIVNIGYNVIGNDVRVYPIFVPSYEQEVRIKEYRRIFGDSCSLVLCEANGKEFIYFDPISKSSDYETLLGKNHKIKIGAVATGDTHNAIGKDISEYIDLNYKGMKEEFLRDGYVNNSKTNILLNNTIFEATHTNRRDGKIALFEIKSPFDKDRKLELIADTSGFDSRYSTDYIATNFYFVGML